MTDLPSGRELAHGWKLTSDAKGRGVLLGPDGAHHHPGDLLALSEVGELYGVDRSKVYAMMRRRTLRGAKKYGAIYLVSVHEVVKSLDREGGSSAVSDNGS